MSGALAIARLDSRAADFEPRFAALLAARPEEEAAVEARVREIVAQVRAGGDRALLALTAELDGVEADSVDALRVAPERCAAALAGLPAREREALGAAAARIRAYHARQRQSSWEYREEDGTVLGQRITPLERVGIYVPGGKASYPSSVLMNAIPARVAGVGEIVMAAPAPGGEPAPLVLAAAALAGVDDVLAIGGAQAVAALAYGTESVRPVDKIVGPGNRWVASAKRQVFGVVGIDMIAGPSEIVVVCDGATAPEWIAVDLFAQAEHDEAARAILISPDAAFLDAVAAAIARLLPRMERREIIRAALEDHGALVRVADLDEAVALVDRLAAEHVELSVADPRALLARIRHAGAVFLGRHTAEVLGDYCAGPNHVLPTARTARFSSPLGVYDFEKRTSVIECSAAGARRLGAVASVLARGEALTAHARSAELRVEAPDEDA